MGDITMTAADVRPLPGFVPRRHQCGEAIDAGELVYLKSDGKVWLADADGATTARGVGIVCAGEEGKTSFAANDYVDVVTLGPVAGASGLTPGGLLYASTTAGAISDTRPAGSSSDYVWVVGYAEKATVIYVQNYTDSFDAQ